MQFQDIWFSKKQQIISEVVIKMFILIGMRKLFFLFQESIVVANFIQDLIMNITIKNNLEFKQNFFAFLMLTIDQRNELFMFP